MELLKKYWVWGMAVALIGIFLSLRFVGIEQTFFFQNDQGRDMTVLWDWMTTNKPPLLGPQTSALPINQSSWYFYILYPAFVLFGFEPISANYTLAFSYVFMFVLGLWIFRKQRPAQISLLTCFFLMAIHPQFIIQNRMVWNPSFVGLFLVMAIVSFVTWLKSGKFTWLVSYALSTALAVSFSYSVAPVLLATLVYLGVTKKKYLLKAIALLVLCFALVNITTLIFEARHGFLITNSLLTRGISPQRADNSSLLSRLNNFVTYGVSSGSLLSDIWVMILVSIAAIFSLFSRKVSEDTKRIGSIWMLTFVFSLMLPVQIHTHYIFGIVTIMFLFVASMPKRYAIFFVSLFCLIYLTPANIKGYLTPTTRTVDEMSGCLKQVCESYQEPIFVSVQANFHPYHNGPEHRFLLKKAGCNVKYIETPGEEANLMAVVMDGSNYIHGETAYNELTMFGKAKEIKRFNCQENFGVAVLRKD